jgi:annexin A7/11
MAHRHKEKKGPTLTPVENFDAAEDARILKEALADYDVNYDSIVTVVCHRSFNQRQEIVKVYHETFNRDLIDDIKSKTRGNFEKLLLALLTPLTGLCLGLF